MKLRVNLLTEELLPKRALLTLNRTLVALFLYALLIGAGIGFYQWHLTTLDGQIKQAEAKQQQLQNLQLQLLESKRQMAASASLQAELNDVKKELEIKKSLQAQIEQGVQPEGKPISSLLEDLAKVNESRVWLEQINVSSNGVSLIGFTSNSEIVPDWLSQVGAHGYLQGVSFGRLALSEQAPWHKFELHTERDKQSEGAQ